jgi:uncharacterized membrane protein YqgA involved in biofilm formation
MEKAPAISSPQLIAIGPCFSRGARIFGCWNGGVPQQAREHAMKVLVDFSYAAFLAAAIGIAVGGTAFSFVWLISVLNA